MSVKQRPDGAWRARFRGPDGREVARHFPTRRQAVAWESEQRAKANRGEWIDDTGRKVTFEAFARSWAAAQPWRDSTAEATRSALERHLIPAFGSRPLQAVRPSEVQAFVKALGQDRSPGTVQNVMRVMGAVYRAAVGDRLVAVSPVESVRLPSYEPEVTIPTRAEVDALLEAAPDRWKALVVVGAGAALRAGEALGLSEDRVRWLHRELVIDRQLVTLPGVRARFGEPKSRRSVRTIPAAAFVMDALAAHVEDFGLGPDRLIFTDELMRPVSRNTFGHRWRAIQASADVEVRFHDLRHFGASTMLSAGVPVPVVAEVLGHSIPVLLRTYAHVLADDRDRARQAIEAAFATGSEGIADSARTAEAIATAT